MSLERLRIKRENIFTVDIFPQTTGKLRKRPCGKKSLPWKLFCVLNKFLSMG